MTYNLQFSIVNQADLAQIEKLQPSTWGSIMPAVNWYLSLPFAHFVKAEINNIVVGCGAVLYNNNSAWLASIIVHETYRNKGIGKVITEYLITTAQNQTSNIYLIGTKLGLPIYQKLGFKNDEEYVFFKPHQLTLPISTKIIAYKPEFENAILAMDKECSGEDRKQLLMPNLKESFVYLNNDSVEGFCMPTFGEGLTFATNTEAGLALLNMRLQEIKGACLPKSNSVAVAFLLEHGFQQNTLLEGTKMYLYKQPIWKPKNQYGRVAGNMG